MACLYAGAVWGLFWIPLRALEATGLHSLWVTVIYFLVCTLCLVPIVILRWKHVIAGGLQLQITAMLSGGALFLYMTAIVHTDVVRVILLVYLTPIWGTLLARIFLGEAITPPTYCCHGHSASERHMNRPMSDMRYSKQRHLPE